MDSIVFYAQLLISIVVFAFLISWYVIPRLELLPKESALIILLIPQAFRHLGLYALVLAAFNPAIPSAWANPTAVGDTITQVLSLVAMIMLRHNTAGAIAMTWVATIVGIGDFLVGSYLTESTHLPLHMLTAGWFLPWFYFPLVLCAYYWTIRFLLK